MKSEQVKQRKAQRLNYLLQLANAYFAAASLCVCFLGLMYDADISYTLTLVLPWTAVFCVLIGIWLYNRRALLGGCAVAALAALAILMLDPLRSYIRGFIGWIPENLLYIRMPFDRIYTPFAQIGFIFLITALIIVLQVKLRLPVLVSCVGAGVFAAFYFYTYLEGYEFYKTSWVLVCVPIFLASCVMGLMSKYRVRDINPASALPVAAIALAITLALTPVFDSMKMTPERRESFSQVMDGLFGHQQGSREDFSVRFSGFALTDSRSLGGALRLSYERRFALRSREPLLLKGAAYDKYDGKSWKNTLNDKKVLENRPYSEAEELENIYQKTFDIYRNYAFGQIAKKRVGHYTVSDSTEGLSRMYTSSATVRIGFEDSNTDGNTIFAVDSGIADCEINIDNEKIYTVDYIIIDRYTPEFAKTVKEAEGESELVKDVALYGMYASQEGISPKIAGLAGQITSGCEGDYEKACRLRDYLSNEYEYALDPPEAGKNDDFAEFFLFEGKKGYCVHFATAMTLMSRSLGIPARYTEGYRMDKTGYNYVLASNAHAWCEVYIKGIGWLPFDAVSEGDFASGQAGESTGENTTASPDNGTSAAVTEGSTAERNDTAAPVLPSSTVSAAEDTRLPENSGIKETQMPQEKETDAVSPLPAGDTGQDGDGGKAGAGAAAAAAALALTAIIVIAIVYIIKSRKRKERLQNMNKCMESNEVVCLYKAICRDAAGAGVKIRPEQTVRDRMALLYEFAARDFSGELSKEYFDAMALAVEKAVYSDAQTCDAPESLAKIYVCFDNCAAKSRKIGIRIARVWRVITNKL